MKQIKEYIEHLENESFVGWNQDEIKGYLTACESIKQKINSITLNGESLQDQIQELLDKYSHEGAELTSNYILSKYISDCLSTLSNYNIKIIARRTVLQMRADEIQLPTKENRV